jgi:hypothetical protein
MPELVRLPAALGFLLGFRHPLLLARFAIQAPPRKFERGFSIPTSAITWALPWRRFPF